MTDTKQTVPAGYRADDKGRLVLEKNIRQLTSSVTTWSTTSSHAPKPPEK